jgi:hypothetical protein
MATRDERLAPMKSRRAAVDAAHEEANRTALLRHARLGEPVSTWRDNQVVWLTPKEVFGMYGLDEFGRAITSENKAN